MLFKAKLKAVIKKKINNIQALLSSLTNIRTKGYTQENLSSITSYGHDSMPPINSNTVLATLNEKSTIILGQFNIIPAIDIDSTYGHAFQIGESWLYSENYVFVAQLDGLMAYKMTNQASQIKYKATMISGEWANKIFGDIIGDDNTTVRGYLNDVMTFLRKLKNELDQFKAIYNAHQHPVPDGTSSKPNPPEPPDFSSVPDNIQPNQTLQDDLNAINQGHTLINDNGQPIP